MFDKKTDVLSTMSDEELAQSAKVDGGAVTTLISRYYSLISALASRRSSNASDVDDLISEGMIALVSAVKSFDVAYGVKFSAFASVCIKNRLNSVALKNAGYPQNFEEFSEDEVDATGVTPETIYIERERLDELYSKAQSLLSEREWQIFRLFLTGSTYDQMAQALGISLKAVDNAMQRVRRKLKTDWKADSL